MKRKVVWLLLGSLVALSLVLASCAAPAPAPVPTPAPTPTPTPKPVRFTPPKEWGLPEGTTFREPDEPKYGGQFTLTWTTYPSRGFDEFYT